MVVSFWVDLCACASGAHARARRASTDYSVRLCAAFSILKLGILVPKTAIFSRSAGLKRVPLRGAEKSSRSPTARSIPHAQKGLNHVPLDNPDRGSSRSFKTCFEQHLSRTRPDDTHLQGKACHRAVLLHPRATTIVYHQHHHHLSRHAYAPAARSALSEPLRGDALALASLR